MKQRLTFAATRDALQGGLIVSCQPVDKGPMDRTDIVVAMAQAAVAGGASGLRIEGAERVRAVAEGVSVPLVGIIKRDLPESPVRITPYIEDVIALAAAGASIIAIDATERARPIPTRTLLAEIHSTGCLAMADCSTLEDARAMADLGCEFLASTLSGYVGGSIPAEPDLKLVRQMAEAGFCTIAEGRYNSPVLARAALEAGAHSVTVGSAITRIENITSWFNEELSGGKKVPQQ